MTVRQEVKRRARRAHWGFFGGIAVGYPTIGLMFLYVTMLDPLMGTVSFILTLLVGATAGLAGVTAMLAGSLYAKRLGKDICCRSGWPLLNVGRTLDQMKCCPYCGMSLDDEMPAKGRHEKSKTEGDVWEDELA